MLENNNIAMKVTITTIVVNSILAFFKFISGIISNSSSMISDAIHTLSDVVTTFIVIIGIKLSNKKSDKEHRYGHERIEPVASIILAGILFITGISIFISSIENIYNNNYIELSSNLALIAALISIIVKEWMYHYTRKYAIKINSSSMLADAWHHRSDALSSIGALIGIIGSYLGYPILEVFACIIISFLIIKTAVEIFIDSVNKLIDKSCDDELLNNMKKVILSEESVIKIDDIKTRLFGNKIYVDLEIAVDGNITLIEAHKIADSVHDLVEENFSNVKHCMVHVNPRDR